MEVNNILMNHPVNTLAFILMDPIAIINDNIMLYEDIIPDG